MITLLPHDRGGCSGLCGYHTWRETELLQPVREGEDLELSHCKLLVLVYAHRQTYTAHVYMYMYMYIHVHVHVLHLCMYMYIVHASSSVEHSN